jgi:hypothetical protein
MGLIRCGRLESKIVASRPFREGLNPSLRGKIRSLAIVEMASETLLR